MAMATIRKRGSRYHVQIRKTGFPSTTQSFLKLKLEQEVWNAFIDQRIKEGRVVHLGTGISPQSGVLLGMYVIFAGDAEEIVDYLDDGFDDLSSSTADNFIKANSSMREMNQEGFTEKVIFDSDRGVYRYFKPLEGGWERYYQDHPTSAGLINLSGVGISDSGTEAVLGYDFLSGPMEAHGNFVRLKLVDGEWKIVDYLDRWIS
jgi:hypothetical protein